jgi:hypothetical protein
MIHFSAELSDSEEELDDKYAAIVRAFNDPPVGA